MEFAQNIFFSLDKYKGIEFDEIYFSTFSLKVYKPFVKLYYPNLYKKINFHLYNEEEAKIVSKFLHSGYFKTRYLYFTSYFNLFEFSKQINCLDLKLIISEKINKLFQEADATYLIQMKDFAEQKGYTELEQIFSSHM